MVEYLHPQVQADLKELIAQDLPWDLLENKSVLITGAAGMLAAYVGFTLLYLNEQLELNIKPIFLARNEENLKKVYGNALVNVDCLVQDVCESIKYSGKIDYIFHAAGDASPHHILNDPVGIISANVYGTKNILDLACNSQTHNIIFASTREIYGYVEGRSSVDENSMGVLNPLNPRDCYPESKRLAEALLTAYHAQHGTNFNTLRIAHVYGPGMKIECDGRVMADLIYDVIHCRDIYLKSTGQAERAFCYVTDAVSGIFRVMLQGVPAQAYNLANENEPIRIVDLAFLLQRLSANGKGVQVATDQGNQAGYTNYARTALNTTRLEALGWCTAIDLKEGLIRTLRSFSEKSTQ